MNPLRLPAALVAAVCCLLAWPAPSTAATYSGAISLGRAHGPNCAGGFPDIKGQCWVCPQGYRHDNILLPPTDNRVCKREGGADRRKGIKIGKSIVGICRKGWLSTNDGGCYTCPNGFSHDIAKFGNQTGVCYHNRPDAYARATHQGGSLVCNQGFFDPIDGGSCWACPANAPVRTLSSVKSGTACQSRACGARGDRPCLITERIPSCDRGLIEDFANNRCVPASAQAAVCIATLTALKAGRSLAAIAKAFDESKARTNALRSRIAAERNRLMDMAARQIAENAHVVPELKRITAVMQTKRRELEALFSPNNFCTLSTAQINQRLAALGLAPHFPARKAGLLPDGLFINAAHAAPGEQFFMGYQVSAALGAGIGAQWSLLFVTDFRGSGGKFMSVGPEVVLNVSGGVSPIGVEFYPKVDFGSFAGWGFDFAISAGPPTKIVSAGVDVSVDDHFRGVQGFGINGAVGAGWSPVDISGAAAYGWKME